MHFMVFANYNEELTPQRPRDDFAAYVRDRDRHPDVDLLHGGTTLDDDGETVNGLLLVVEAPSLGAARAFVAESPYGQAGLLADADVRPWNWMTGRPG